MKGEYKAFLLALFTMLIGLSFLIWGLMDFSSLLDGPGGLIIVITFIVIGSIFLMMGLIFVVLFIRDQRDVLHKKRHNCAVCGTEIQLETKFCRKCGAENVIREEAFEKLEKLEGRIEKFKASRSERLQSSRWAPTARDIKNLESEERRLFNEERDLRVKKTKLIIGSTREGKLEWIKTQHYDLKRTIQEIADDLGESMIAVGKYLDELENLP